MILSIFLLKHLRKLQLPEIRFKGCDHFIEVSPDEIFAL